MSKRLLFIGLALGVAVVLFAGCAPGNERWAPVDNRANFWAGLWHGLIVIITFVVSWFTDDVRIYEANNVGFGYNLGFIFGCMISLGGGVRAGTHRKRKVRVIHRSVDPDRIARRVERGVKEGLKAAFADRAEGVSDAEWEDLGRRIEERVKQEMRDLDEVD